MSEIEQGYTSRTLRRDADIALDSLVEQLDIDIATPTKAEVPKAKKEPVGVKESQVEVLKESPLTQVAGGMVDAVRETLNVPTDIINLFKDKEMQGLGDFLPKIPRSELAANNVLRSGAQFLTTFVPLFGAMKGVKAIPKIGGILQAELAGSVGAATAFDPEEPRLSNLINNLTPALKNVVTEFLATDPDDSAALGRAKNALEGLGMGALLNGFLGAIRAMRAARGLAKQAKEQVVSGLPAKKISDEELMKQLVGAQDEISKVIKKEGFGPIEGTPAMKTAVDNRQRVFNEVFNAKHPEKPIGTTVIFNNQEMILTKVEFDMTQSVGSLRKGFAGGRDFKETLTLKTKEGEIKFISFEEFDKLKVVEKGGKIKPLETEEDFKQRVVELADLQKKRFKAKRGKRGKEVTLSAAEKSEFKNIKNILGIKEGTALNAEDIIAVGKVVINSFDNMKSLGGQIKAELAQGNFPAKLVSQYTDEINTLGAVDPKFFGVSGESGRALQAHTIISDEIGRLRSMAAKVSEADENTTIEQLINMVDTFTTPKQASKFIRRIKAVPGAITEAWLAGLLTSPKTHLVNILGNTSNVFFHIPERYVASFIPGTKVGTFEFAYSVYGMLHAFGDALRIAGKTLKTGEPSEALLRSSKLEGFKRRISAEAFELDKTGVAGKAVDYLGEFIRVPFRGLMAADDFFKAINQRAELYALAKRTVDEKGLKGPAASKRMWEIINDPPPNIAQKAGDFAAYQTFTNDLGKFGSNIQKFANTHAWAKFILPFVRTPINIFKYSFERTPLNMPVAIWKKVVKKGGAEADLAIAKASLGSMAMTTFAMYASAGYITGRGPKSATLRRMKMNTGWRPYSINTPSGYISYNRFDPVGMSMGFAADFVEGSQYLDYWQLEELAVGIVMSSQALISKTYMTGVRNAMDMINTGEGGQGIGKGARAAGKLIASFVPTIVRDIERATDPQLRRLEGEGIAMRWWNGVLAGVPYFSSNVPVERNLFGEEILLETGFASIFNPAYISPKKDDKEMQALIDNEVIVGKLPKWIHGKSPAMFGFPRPDDAVKLSTEQHDRYKVLAGEGLRETMNSIINSPAYQFAVPGRLGGRHKMLFNAIQDNRERAREILVNIEFPDLLEKIQKKIIGLEAAREGLEDLIPEELRR